MSTSGYEIDDLIYESASSLVYHGRRCGDAQAVIIKMFRETYPTPERIAWFKREFLVTKGLQLESVARAYSLEQVRDHWSIILEECASQSLDLLELAGNLSLVDLLELALGIAEALWQVHRNYIIHKDINPTNIILNTKTRELKLIDFGSSTVLSKEEISFSAPNILEGTLAYISPEQTGRMNRPVDYRTDFYSLGVTLYQLATGRLPFQTEDTMAMIHCHIAREPEPPAEVDIGIPTALSDLILKLMAKKAEDRYQTVYGLKADLERCLAQIREKGSITPFPLGEADISDQLILSDRLYGREDQVEVLLHSFDRVRDGGNEMLLVRGGAGIGKTALVREVYRSITASRGFFVTGKLDQYQRDIPYDSMIQAFGELVEQLLTESTERLADWREQISAALGGVARVLVDIIPELGLILGETAPVESLPPVEAQNRVDLVFRKLTSVIASEEHPLVIFLDDLQWIDTATLRLIQNLMKTGCPHLMIIGSYRDNEVTESHPLQLAVKQLEQMGVRIAELELGPLSQSHLVEMLAETLHLGEERVQPLARSIIAKTGGNPFFFRKFLELLHDEGLIHFDSGRGHWAWDDAEIAAHPIADNIVSLMSSKLSDLPAETLELLRVAACIGNRFELGFLTGLFDISLKEAAEKIWPAVTGGFIMPMDNNYKLADVDDEGLHGTIEIHYKFVHDRIQNAAYLFNPEDSLPGLHHQIGRALLADMEDERRTDRRLFDVVSHLEAAPTPEPGPARDELIGLYRDAGIAALETAAYQVSYHYLKTAYSLFSPTGSVEEAWSRDYARALELTTRTAQLAYLEDDREAMGRLIDTVLGQARDLLDKVPVFEIEIQSLIHRNDFAGAIEKGRHVLDLLGTALPESPSQDQMLAAISEATEVLGDRPPESLLEIPALEDPRLRATMRLLELIYLPSLTAQPMLAPIIASRQVTISITHGNADESAVAYVNFGLTLSGVTRQYAMAFQFGDLAMKLMNRLGIEKYRARTTIMSVCNLAHWKNPIREDAPALLAAYPSALESGELDFAANCLTSYAVMGYLAGTPLDDVVKRFRNADRAMTRLDQGFYRAWLRIWWQSVLNWRGRNENPLALVGEAFDETVMRVDLEGANDFTALFLIDYNKAVLAFHFDDLDAAEALLPALRDHNQQGGAMGPASLFYALLIRLAADEHHHRLETENTIEAVNDSLQQMIAWAELAPANYAHKVMLIRAELDRVQGRFMEAREHYDQAIEGANRAGYLQEEALALKLAARFFLAREQYRLAHHYMKDAAYTYARWGAIALVRRLEHGYPQIFGIDRAEGDRRATTATLGVGTSQFDLASIARASQAIAGELVQDRMLSKVMEVLLEIAGATKGCLVIKKDTHWLVEVEGTVEGETGVLVPAAPLGDYQGFPQSIVNFVVQTHKAIVIDDSTKDERFNKDTYLREGGPRSILCSPILHQGELMATLYLENDLGTGVFTEDRLEVLQLLSAQIAISIENAALYAEMEEKVRDRTAALEERNEQILASMRYAKQIQTGILPTQELARVFPESFVIFLPRDLVSGDFFWVCQIKGATFVAVVDCTGHGVPGALMSMVGNTLLDKLIRDQGMTDPAAILTSLQDGVRAFLWREVENRANVGMDICLCRIDTKPRRVVFAGAMRPLYHLGKKAKGNYTLDVLPPVKRSIDGGRQKKKKAFVNHTLTVKRGDAIYLSTDGYTDQQSKSRRKIGTAQLKRLLVRHADAPMEEQKNILLTELEAHRGLEPQRDDITLLGIGL